LKSLYYDARSEKHQIILLMCSMIGSSDGLLWT